MNRLSVFGIRHHGPGSARSLHRALERLQPDAILVEGPPDAQEAIPWVSHAAMQPPVALLVYAPEMPRLGVYYPFSVFSPEWQAIQWGLAHQIPVEFMDLPQSHRLAEAANQAALEPLPEPPTLPEGSDAVPEAPPAASETVVLPADPLAWLAQAAGYQDSERWWEHLVESRWDDTDLFAAILEMMSALRQEIEQTSPPPPEFSYYFTLNEARREAAMRTSVRKLLKSGCQRLAVVCGAWHAPALLSAEQPHVAKADLQLLKGLPKLKVKATWVPWTNGRLALRSGYGAGIESPGWYAHLWQAGEAQLTTTQAAISWITRAAHLLRAKDLDASSAQVIDAVRLAESLAALRGMPLPGLQELNEALQTVFLFGEGLPLRLIEEQLVIGERLGSVPPDVPQVPLQLDLSRQQKRLRLVPQSEPHQIDLDLRGETDQQRSILLHRLSLLGIEWGRIRSVRGKLGTFHEFWDLKWQPELAIQVIEASIWGNTIEQAAAAQASHQANTADLPGLAQLLQMVILADLPQLVEQLAGLLQARSALSGDVVELISTLPPLARIARYGNVRQSDRSAVQTLLDGLVQRVCLGILPACNALDDQAAKMLYEKILEVEQTLALLDNPTHLEAWQRTLQLLLVQSEAHAMLRGRSCRALLDTRILDADAASQHLAFALSAAVEPAEAGAWLDGFLRGSGALLVHHPLLWQLLDSWVCGLPAERFRLELPLLRRIFSTFGRAERRLIGEQVAHGAKTRQLPVEQRFDPQRADRVLPVLAQILGLQPGQISQEGLHDE